MSEAEAQERFAALLDEHRGIVFKVASAYSRTAADCQDLAQTIALEAWRAFPRFDRTRSFSTWFYRIALNVAISFFRAQQRRSDRTQWIDEAAFERIAVASPTGEDDRAAALRTLIDRLNEFDRALILLYLDDESYASIAEI